MSRGISAEQIDGSYSSSELGTLVPCYVGNAPYWQLNASEWREIAGTVMIIRSLEDAKNKIGHYIPTSGAWRKEFSICEAVNAHFNDSAITCGPIIVLINKAEVSVKADATESNVAILNGVGYVPVDGLAVLSTVSIDGKEKGVDYSATYDDNGQNIIIKDLNNSLSGTVVVKYNEVENLANLNIASVTFDSIDYFEQLIGEVPSVFLAPQLEEDYLDGSSAAGTVASKLKQIVEGRINSHWYTQAIIQMSGERDNLSEEKALKGYDSHKTKVCWPYVKKNSGLVYSLSVLFSVAKLSVDIENDGIPFESASNEIITDVSYLCDKDGNRINQTEKEANALNEIGIATANFVSGSWRTWGICMANYVEVVKDAILPEKLNDVAVQMRDYISNDFQKKYIDHIDKPIPSRVANEIVGDYQLDLNTLVSNGALLFGSIEYDSSASDELNGDFVFNIAETHTPPGKSITAKIGYTKEGLSSYEGSDE